MRNPSLMSRAEIAGGRAVEPDPLCPPFELTPLERPPHEVISEVLLELLQRGRVAVGFSGGIDSSGLLCLATELARKHALPEPIAVTARYANAPDSEESEWQELVIAHLGLDDWIKVPLDDEVDAVGPEAAIGLLEEGVRWPPLAHSKQPLFRQVPGCIYVNGNGGDEITAPTQSHVVKLLITRRIGPRPAALKALVSSLTPALFDREREPRYPAWIPRRHHRELRALAEPVELGGEYTWHHALEHRTNAPWALRGHRGLILHAARHGVEMVQPLTDRRVIRSMLWAGGRLGFGARSIAAQELFADVLPRQVAKRRTKADFTEAIFNNHSRAFISAWDGNGAPDWVEPEVFRDAVLAGGSYDCLALLQYVWLAKNGSTAPNDTLQRV